jgi:hypothetical protein
MVESSVSPPPADQEGRPTSADKQSIFLSHFTDDQRRELLTEDREAQLGISAILACLIAMGMVLGIISVFLVRYLGI